MKYFVCFCFMTTSIYAQQTVTLSGTFHESQGLAARYYECVLYKNDSLPVKSTLTDEKGYFSLRIEPGKYILKVRQLGKIFYAKELEIAKDQHLGDFVLEDKATNLNEVVVTGKKSLVEQKVDRLVFNVENSISATGGDAVDALKLTPRVLVRNDEQIIIVGKGGVSVMVDDRLIRLAGEDLVRFLKSIRADDIKSIEVITNPPAKYSAEGNGGLINIVTKKAKPGQWSASLNGGYRQATYPTGTGAVSYNLQRGKLTLTSGVNASDGSIRWNANNETFYPLQKWDLAQISRVFSKNLSGNIGLDYNLSKKVSMGGEYRLSINKGISNGLSKSDVIDNTSSRPDFFLRTDSNRPSKSAFSIANYHVIFKPDTLGKKLSLDVDWFNSKAESDQSFKTDRYLGNDTFEKTLQSADNQGNQNTSNYSVNLDMEHPAKWATFNYGGRVSFTRTNNDFKYFNTASVVPVLDKSQSNVFMYKEDTQSLYASIEKSFGKKWGSKVGLRIENTNLESYSETLNLSIPRQYTKLFPTAYLNFTPTEDHGLTISYGRRINRPNFRSFNPFVWVRSPYSYAEGNPYILPSFTHNVELGYIYKDLLTTSLYLSHTENGYDELTIIDPNTKITVDKPVNYLTTNTIGINQNIYVDILRRVQITLSSNAGYSLSRSLVPITVQKLDGWFGDMLLDIDMQLNKSKTIFVNVNQFWEAGGVFRLYRTNAYGQINLSIKMLLLKKRLTVVLLGVDLLRTSIVRFETYSNSIKELSSSYSDTRSLRISVTYHIGKKFSTDGNRQKNQEEYDRIN